ncbi:MAG TPA: AMP-binding protein, partial [Gemmatimonadales bacterium]
MTAASPAEGSKTLPPPNMADYDRECAAFSWDAARGLLSGLPGDNGLNIAHEAVDRHAAGAAGDRVALRWIGREGEVRDATYSALRSLTNRFALVLEQLGIGAGDRVFALAGRVPELYLAALGTLKRRGIFCPLFS